MNEWKLNLVTISTLIEHIDLSDHFFLTHEATAIFRLLFRYGRR